MQNLNGFFRPGQTRLLKKLFALCEKGSLGNPSLDTWYLCVARNDYTHWTTKHESDMVFVGYATRSEGFNHLWFELGVCRECFEAV